MDLGHQNPYRDYNILDNCSQQRTASNADYIDQSCRSSLETEYDPSSIAIPRHPTAPSLMYCWRKTVTHSNISSSHTSRQFLLMRSATIFSRETLPGGRSLGLFLQQKAWECYLDMLLPTPNFYRHILNETSRLVLADDIFNRVWQTV